jgi:hypothetical protein
LERPLIDIAKRNTMTHRYVTAFAEHGSHVFIKNLGTQVRTHQWGKQIVPLTINDNQAAETFVCSPSVAYVDYVKEELPRLPNQSLTQILKLVVNCVAVLLSMAKVNKIVHINNWMISTNLPANLEAGLAAAQTRSLTETFPDYFLAMRSLNWQHSAELMNALVDAGWLLLPSRQVYLVDDVARESLTRRDSRNDQKIWSAMGLTYEELADMSDDDAVRITRLYEMLYLEKYSRLNPAFGPEFIKLTHHIGMIKYLVLRDQKGVIQGFGGFTHLGKNGTMPLMGYDTTATRELGLYRLVCHAGSLYAARHDLQLNMSSGAAKYKMTRGAKPKLEYTAYYMRHLAAYRRLPFHALRLAATRIGIPILRRYEL